LTTKESIVFNSIFSGPACSWYWNVLASLPHYSILVLVNPLKMNLVKTEPS